MNSELILNELKNGNSRFVENKTVLKTKVPAQLKNGQNPHTIILACADSRVPPEIIFDQDLGDLFVVRIAGNTASPEAIGSIEYAAANLGSQVLIVLGHTDCGAVTAAINHFDKGEAVPSNYIKSVITPLKKPIEKLKSKESNLCINRVVDENVKSTVSHLVNHSEIIKGMVSEQKLKVVPAKYHLHSGFVEFF